MTDDEHVPAGRLRRLSRLAYLTARTTGDLLAAQARRKLGGSDVPKDDLRKAGERILATLGELKGAALKLGQALAMDPDALPEEARSVVARLLAQAPQRMDYAQVAEVVRAELGRAPEDLFAQFERDPLAAASLGQVHAARLQDGREVVVKVQHPPGADPRAAPREAAGRLHGVARLRGRTVPGGTVARLRHLGAVLRRPPRPRRSASRQFPRLPGRQARRPGLRRHQGALRALCIRVPRLPRRERR